MLKKSRRNLFLCLVLAVSLLAFAVQVPASAGTLISSTALKLSTMYYSQLTSQEQEIYKILVRTDLRRRMSIRWNVSLTLKVDMDSSPDSWSELKKVKNLEDMLARAITAYRFDYMEENYWLSSAYSLSAVYDASGLEEGYVVLRYYTVRFEPVYEEALLDENSVQNAIGKLYTYVKTNRKNSTRQATIQSIVTVMAKNMVYANPLPTWGSTPSGVLLSKYGRRGNSEAYARTLFILCKKFGIPVVYVQSTTHTFCYVQMEDGVWYGVDPTWADQGDRVNKKWVLYGTAVVKKYDMSKAHNALTSKNGISLCAINISKHSYAK